MILSRIFGGSPSRPDAAFAAQLLAERMERQQATAREWRFYDLYVDLIGGAGAVSEHITTRHGRDPMHEANPFYAQTHASNGPGPTNSKGGDVAEAIARVHELANRLEVAGSDFSRLGSRLFLGGAIPDGRAGSASNAPARPGQIGALADALDLLELHVGGIQGHANDLQRL